MFYVPHGRSACSLVRLVRESQGCRSFPLQHSLTHSLTRLLHSRQGRLLPPLQLVQPPPLHFFFFCVVFLHKTQQERYLCLLLPPSYSSTSFICLPISHAIGWCQVCALTTFSAFSLSLRHPSVLFLFLSFFGPLSEPKRQIFVTQSRKIKKRTATSGTAFFFLHFTVHSSFSFNTGIPFSFFFL